MGKFKFSKLATAALAFTLLSTSIPVEKAEAGIFTSGNKTSGSSSGGAAWTGTWSWGLDGETGKGLKLDWAKGTGTKKVTVPSDINYISTGKKGRITKDISGTKWVHIRLNGIKFGGGFAEMNKDRYVVWPFIDHLLFDSKRLRIDKASAKASLPGEWVTYVKQNGSTWNDYSYIYKGQRIDAVNMVAYPVKKQQKIENKTIKTIVKISGNDSSGNFDNIKKGLKWNFENGVAQTKYAGQSLPKEYKYKKGMSIVVYEIKQTKKYPAYQHMSNVRDPGYGTPTISYIKTEKTFNNTFEYNMKQPQPTASYYAPYDLNKANGNGSGAMTSAQDTALIKKYMSEYSPSGKAMNIKPDNLQGIKDGSAMKTLDTNSPLNFSVVWGNDQFGFPGSKIYDEEPKTGWNWYQDVTGYWQASGSYTKPKTNLTGDRTDTKNYRGVINTGVNSDEGSIAYNNGKEQVGPSALSITKPKSGQKDTFQFRTTNVGNYNLTNGDRNIPFSTLNYSAGLRFKYGFKYSGNVTVNGFQAPSSVQTNLYETSGSKQVRQPILMGKFEAKTVAGTNRTK